MNARPAARLILIALSLVALPLALASCGNKGPLILPPKSIPVDPSTLPPRQPVDAPAPATEAPANQVPATDAEDIDGKKKDTAVPTPVPAPAGNGNG
ncbi:lipoprotein [Lysobacter sp. TAF61]|uniref:LPS translocon maturation chaperone LptM n=1 Tax=Lysobacter sp. TAF61 TaxID=3233072 RepID=UPI003F9A8E5B